MSIVVDDRIGTILVTMNVVTREELDNAIAWRDAGDPRRVTEILGVTDEQIEAALKAQDLLRRGEVIEAANRIADVAFGKT